MAKKKNIMSLKYIFDEYVFNINNGSLEGKPSNRKDLPSFGIYRKSETVLSITPIIDDYRQLFNSIKMGEIMGTAILGILVLNKHIGVHDFGEYTVKVWETNDQEADCDHT